MPVRRAVLREWRWVRGARRRAVGRAHHVELSVVSVDRMGSLERLAQRLGVGPGQLRHPRLRIGQLRLRLLLRMRMRLVLVLLVLLLVLLLLVVVVLLLLLLLPSMRRCVAPW